MTLLQSPQKKLEIILKEIEKGITREDDTVSLMQILDKQPSMIPEVIGSLASILAKDGSKSFISACLVLSRIAHEYPDKVSDSLEMIMERLSDRKKEPDENEWVPALELLTRINEKHPEKMRTAVPSLLVALGNSNKTVREIAYFLLANIASINPDFFEYSSNALIKVLNGLNIDQRLYACKVIGIIAAINPRIVEKTYEVIEDFSLSHPDNNLRSESGFVVDLLRPGKNSLKQPDSKVPLVKQEIVEKDRGSIEDAFQMMITGSVIESAALVGTNGRIVAQTGRQIDDSLLSKLISILSFERGDQSRSRITIEQANKKIVAVCVGHKAIFVAVTGADTSMGMLIIALNKSVEKLNEIIMDAGFTETL